jgi:hypothetical protein
MKVKTDVDVILAGFAAFYSILMFKQGMLVLTALAVVGMYMYTKSMRVVVGTFVLMIALDWLNKSLNPKVKVSSQIANLIKNIEPVEGFQVKDPVSIHQRIIGVKKEQPLQPKVSQVMGVLESPEILDSLQISEIDSDEGASSVTLPASLTGNVSIRTPSEGSVAREVSPDLALRGNPFLQNGEDDTAVSTALSKKGSELLMTQGAGEVGGTTVGPSTL